MAGTATARSGRPRVAPRRGGARGLGSGIRWERVGRVALLGVLVVIVLLYIPPVSHWVQQSRTAARGHEQVRELKRERAQLRARLRELSGPGAVEREARRLGMVEPGERPYVVAVPKR
ncbi:MAG TPA: septum formation initiator family protein [Thermoleophilaceae bacterium]|nr:septum formation initiator family protein [Thermoleophilaceae bacterium]